MTIPAKLHFCWIGARIPWAYVFAVISASHHSELPDIFLHHTDCIDEGPELRALQCAPRVQLRRIDPARLLAHTGGALGLGNKLAVLYGKASQPAMHADLLRAAILYEQGGIYLDLDTITVASLLPLTNARAFVGSEYIVWPRFVRRSWSPVLWARHLSLDLVRKLLRRLPSGWRIFRWIERLYVVQVSNAVMGAEIGSPLLAAYLQAMTDVPAKDLIQRCALGPSLLQSVIDGLAPPYLTVHRPEAFYPLAPEISAHWFRIQNGIKLFGSLSAKTRIVHWYASVRTRREIDIITPLYVRENRQRQSYSALVCAYLDQSYDVVKADAHSEERAAISGMPFLP